jgi:two-component system, cell cycle sensor histidine kinase and response regulator CckA
MKMEAVGRLAGGVAHDLNNALTPLLGIGGLLLWQMRPGTEWYDNVMAMRESGERCANLTRQLPAFSRSETMEVTVFNLNDVVANMVEMLSRVIGEDIELVKTIDLKLGRVRADIGQMEQIIVSPAINARDAMPNGGRSPWRQRTSLWMRSMPVSTRALSPGSM